MSSPRQRYSRALAALALTGLTATSLTVLASAAQAAPDGTQLVISEVYGAGGNSGASYNADFVELFNPTGAAIPLGTLSVQYRSSGGTANPTGVVPLSGSLAPGDHLLVQMSAAGSTGAALPTPDVVASPQVLMSGTAGTVFLANQTTALVSPPTGSVTGNAAILDLVGYGASNTFEGTAVGGFSNATSPQRAAIGTDTDNNAADFSVATPTPDQPRVEIPPPTAATIEQIQGTGFSSPLSGQNVITSGVATAVYPVLAAPLAGSGFNGFYLQQTPETATDPSASDGVFVLSAAEVGEVQVGDYVTVTGLAGEDFGLTRVVASNDGVAVGALPTGQTPPAATATAFPDTDVEREDLEGMLLDPQGDYTVTEPFQLNRFAEIGLASGTTPLVQPTEVADAQDAAAIAAAQADIEARALVLDDGANLDFQTNDAAKDLPLPWLTGGGPVRTGAAVTFTGDVVLSFAFGDWRFQPTSRVTDNGAGVATFDNTRESAPDEVGGDIRLASFNVLNYFTTTGEEYVAAGGSCSFFNDRDGNPITTDDCGETGPRGAANDANLARQQAKIVHAINALGADVVSLEEIENSAHYGPDRDAALSTLVAALNADAGSTVWQFVPTPASAGDQTDEDVIRTAFIYRLGKVVPDGPSVILEHPAFDNAREPLAQLFHPVGAPSSSDFVAIVNHFKSKGSGVDDGTGQGLANPDRIAQAQALVTFADQQATAAGTDLVYLLGDFNAYSQEDPMQVLYGAGYTDLGSTYDSGRYSYVFDGLVGSLDHVLASPAAATRVTGAAHWNINSVESVAYEYSRFNYNVTSFYDQSPFRSSDHDPLVVGLDLLPNATTTSFTVAPDRLVAKVTEPVVSVTVEGTSPMGVVEVYADGIKVGEATLSGGSAQVTLPAFKKAGTYVLRVSYLGDGDDLPSSSTQSVTVVTKGKR